MVGSKIIYVIDNMGIKDLTNMYAQSPRATGPSAQGIHIRQITSDYVSSNMYQQYHLQHSKIHPNI